MQKTNVTIESSIIAVLEAGDLRGGKYYLPGQLARKDYEAVNKVLTLMGGKWNKSAKAHVFDRDPASVLEETIRTGSILDEKKAFQFFETPDHVVDELMELAKIEPGHESLEPSAGRGVISLRMLQCTRMVTVVEAHQERAEILRTHGYLAVNCGDFLQESGHFDRIVMNPPFSMQQDIRHISHAVRMLKRGGRLVAICCNGSRQNDQLRPSAVHWKVLPAGTFKDTAVTTAIGVWTV